MRNSNYARLIQAEKVYKEKIRQQEIAIAELKAKIKYYERILRQDVPAIEAAEVIDAELVEEDKLRDAYKGGETWTMWHDPNGNEYEAPETIGFSWCLICGKSGLNENAWIEHRKTCK